MMGIMPQILKISHPTRVRLVCPAHCYWLSTCEHNGSGRGKWRDTDACTQRQQQQQQKLHIVDPNR